MYGNDDDDSDACVLLLDSEQLVLIIENVSLFTGTPRLRCPHHVKTVHIHLLKHYYSACASSIAWAIALSSLLLLYSNLTMHVFDRLLAIALQLVVTLAPHPLVLHWIRVSDRTFHPNLDMETKFETKPQQMHVFNCRRTVASHPSLLS